MAVSDTLNRYKGLLSTVGRPAVNALFPNDIEMYAVALELVNSKDETVEYFLFPINPKEIRESYSPIMNVKKTAGGITTISTQTFVPTDITLQGNFGRQFKFLVGKEVVSFSAFSFSSVSGQVNGNRVQDFSPSIKTGYGCSKILERIVKTASQLDDNNAPHKLYFYNLALGNNYIVKPMGIDFTQNESHNMIWDYNLQLKSLARIEDLASPDDQRALTATLSANNIIQKAGNSVLNEIKSALF